MATFSRFFCGWGELFRRIGKGERAGVLRRGRRTDTGMGLRRGRGGLKWNCTVPPGVVWSPLPDGRAAEKESPNNRKGISGQPRRSLRAAEKDSSGRAGKGSPEKQKKVSFSRDPFGWKKGLEPSAFGTTIRRSNQLSYIHHVIRSSYRSANVIRFFVPSKKIVRKMQNNFST